jgi:mannitol 2-dehydrogenase
LLFTNATCTAAHWVIEDNFVDGERPPWESVGAVLVPDVIPHELMKVRLLNVTHSAMCYAGILAGCTHVHEVGGCTSV